MTDRLKELKKEFIVDDIKIIEQRKRERIEELVKIGIKVNMSYDKFGEVKEVIYPRRCCKRLYPEQEILSLAEWLILQKN